MKINFLSEYMMALMRPDIFDGSLTISEYEREKSKYLEYIKPVQEYLSRAEHQVNEMKKG